MAVKHGGAGSHRASHHQAFRRDLRTPTLTLLTLGGIMGSGLFLASGLVIHRAGPVVLLLFAIAAAAMYLEITALAEMAIAAPSPGSFLALTDQVLGRGWTFVTGWIFWFSSVLTMSSEVTAGAVFSRFWFPGVPLWVFSLVYSAGIVGVNFLSVRGFGRIEDMMAGVKTVAVLSFILLAVGLIWRGAPAGGHPGNVLAGIGAHGGWLPHGWLGAAPGLLLVLFAYAGTGVIGLAAAETRSPRRTIGRAVGFSTVAVVVLYLGAIAALLALVPWSRYSGATSPFTTALEAAHIPAAPLIMNLVLIMAVLSTMNAALYSNVRVLYRLARDRQAPKIMGRLNARGQPAYAILASSGLLALTIVLAYLLPKKAYAYLVTATGFQAMFIWMMVCLTQLYYRPYRTRRGQPVPYRQPGFPVSSLGVIGLVLVAMGLSLFAPGERIGAIVGAAAIVLTALVWMMVRRRLAAPATH